MSARLTALGRAGRIALRYAIRPHAPRPGHPRSAGLRWRVVLVRVHARQDGGAGAAAVAGDPAAGAAPAHVRLGELPGRGVPPGPGHPGNPPAWGARRGTWRAARSCTRT